MRKGRKDKAIEFADSAADLATLAADDDERSSAYVTLLVLAGIAASDVLCCAALGQYQTGDNHQEAVALLRRVDAAHSKDLATLLALKTKTAYSALPISAADRSRATRACDRLIQAVRDLPPG